MSSSSYSYSESVSSERLTHYIKSHIIDKNNSPQKLQKYSDLFKHFALLLNDIETPQNRNAIANKIIDLHKNGDGINDKRPLAYNAPPPPSYNTDFALLLHIIRDKKEPIISPSECKDMFLKISEGILTDSPQFRKIVSKFIRLNDKARTKDVRTFFKINRLLHSGDLPKIKELFDKKHFYDEELLLLEYINHNLMRTLIRQSKLDVLKFLHKYVPTMTHDAELMTLAAKYGQLNIMKWLENNGCSYDNKIFLSVCMSIEKTIPTSVLNHLFKKVPTQLQQFNQQLVRGREMVKDKSTIAWLRKKGISVS